MMEIKHSEFKGNPMMEIVTYTDDKGKVYGIKFGKKKWAIILDHLDQIREFVGTPKTEPEEESPF